LPDALRNRWQPISDEIEASTGITPDAFALSAYDALFVVNLALQRPKPLKNFNRFKAEFIEEAEHYRGVTGSTALDAAGDRETGATSIFGRCDCATGTTGGCESELTITAFSPCSDRGGRNRCGRRFRRSQSAATEALAACLPAFLVRACDRHLEWRRGLAAYV